MAGRKSDFTLTKLDDLFTTQAQRDEEQLSKIRDIPLELIDDFPDHPFKVRDDEDMMQLVESVKERGVITPATVRQKEDGRYELVSGHRRKRACELAGFETLRSEIVDLNRDEATILMVESNFQRSEILPSEKAFAYKMRLEAMKRQAGRPTKNNLEETASAIFKSYFVTFEHYGGNMPKNWKQATIGDVVSVSRGASPRPIQDYISQSGMPWVKISDASSSVSKYLFKTAEYIIPEGIQNSRTVTKGMMIVSNSASPGLPMIMEITACVHDGWLIIDDYDCVTQEFMYYHFLNERQSLISSSNGSVFNNLKIDT